MNSKEKTTRALLCFVILPSLFLTMVLPLFVYAQETRTLSDIADLFLKIFGAIVPIIIALALIAFLWGVAKFILNAGNEQARTEGKNLMIWGIIAFFIMFSVWGIVQILVNTLGIDPVFPFFAPPPP